ncbi:MAG: rRNA maturation RNase YbeY [Bacteroidales bacterium]|nr:rRNA maturation RNase YbeY [Bacteroidales bacterium]
MKINIFYDQVKFRLRLSKKVKKLIEKVIREEKKTPGDLSFILTSDENIIEINREFLKHDYFTDVIAFSDNKENIINGEVYISVETVRNNANNYKVSLKEEILRVIIHGTLHLCGYDDKKMKGKMIMREKERKWINIANKLVYGIQT